jgi:outer membrane protein OmpA-like peptidoglycan-associated protein
MARPRYKIDENYICLSDIMMGLMVIFLFISISYIMEVFSTNFVKDEMYNTINDEMVKELQKNNIKLGKDLSLKFINNDTDNQGQLFEPGKKEMTENFKRKLDEIWQPYQNIITRDSFLNYISEIRIEGHTDTSPPKNNPIASYEYNLDLSSQRAQEVLRYIRQMTCYKNLSDTLRQRLQFLMTANGMSYSRALNDSSEVSYLSAHSRINNDLSRRVEFKLVTTNQKLVESFLKNEK